MWIGGLWELCWKNMLSDENKWDGNRMKKASTDNREVNWLLSQPNDKKSSAWVSCHKQLFSKLRDEMLKYQQTYLVNPLRSALGWKLNINQIRKMEKFNGGFNTPRGCDEIMERERSFVGDLVFSCFWKSVGVLLNIKTFYLRRHLPYLDKLPFKKFYRTIKFFVTRRANIACSTSLWTT